MIKTIIVDDEPAALERYSSYVEECGRGFSVVGRCSSSRDAFAAVGRTNPAVLFTDIRMPGEDGLSLLSRLRDSGWKGVAVVISGYDDFTYAQQAIRLGVFDFLLKPVFPEDMKALLCKLAAKLASFAGPESTKFAIDARGVLPEAPPGAEVPEAVRRALAFVELRYDSRFALDDAARAACVSPSWLSSSFKKIYGCSFMEYARSYRIGKAREFLAAGELPMKEIADRLAFPDLPTFSKLFRKIVGTSPGAYRKAGGLPSPGAAAGGGSVIAGDAGEDRETGPGRATSGDDGAGEADDAPAARASARSPGDAVRRGSRA